MPELYRMTKSVYGVSGLALDEKELALINMHTLREYAAEELFAFKVTACDNEIDRDTEAFTATTLEQMAGIYVGKTVLDATHIATAENQCARVYAAEVIRERGKSTSYGEAYARLEVRCYMPRSDTFAELIQLIETGIRKEVSVGCSVARKTCSICGKPYWSSECEHTLRMEYENRKTCFIKLEDAKDAYEISFVAVPAQPAAGVTKSGSGDTTPPFMAELHGVMEALKSLSADLRSFRGHDENTHNNESHPPDDVEELIRSASALYTKHI